MMYEEDGRVISRQKVNTKLLKFLKESKKVRSINESFNDINLWVAMTSHMFLYDDAITTKMSVNF